MVRKQFLFNCCSSGTENVFMSVSQCCTKLKHWPMSRAETFTKWSPPPSKIHQLEHSTIHSRLWSLLVIGTSCGQFTGQEAVMPCGWEGNRRSGVALAMRHRLQWFIHLRAHGLDREMSSPPTLSCGVSPIYRTLAVWQLWLNDYVMLWASSTGRCIEYLYFALHGLMAAQ